MTNLVYLQISIDMYGKEFKGRIVIALFGEVAPLTVENFRCLCTGEKGIGKVSGKVSPSL